MSQPEATYSGREAGLSRLAQRLANERIIYQLAKSNEYIGVSSGPISSRIGLFSTSEGSTLLYLEDDDGRPIYFKDSIAHKVILAKIPDLGERVIELMESPFTRLQQLAPENRGFIAGQELLDPDSVERMYDVTIHQIKEAFSGYTIT